MFRSGTGVGILPLRVFILRSVKENSKTPDPDGKNAAVTKEFNTLVDHLNILPVSGLCSRRNCSERGLGCRLQIVTDLPLAERVAARSPWRSSRQSNPHNRSVEIATRQRPGSKTARALSPGLPLFCLQIP